MTPEEARLRELRADVQASLDYNRTAPFVVARRTSLESLLDALSAERERGDRAVGIVMAIKDGPMIECIPDNDIQDMIRAFLSEENSRHG